MGLKREGKEFYTEHLPQILARLNQLLILTIEPLKMNSTVWEEVIF
jgi:hypothetical protein